MKITLESLKKFAPQGDENYLSAIADGGEVLKKYGIDNDLKFSHFVAQAACETGGFKAFSENLNYSSKALRSVFRKYYRRNPALAIRHARKPENIANHVYGKRMGNTARGDGWRYRGRGIFQLTGKNNYRRYGKKLGIDLLSDPDLAKDPAISLEIACAYWKAGRLNKYAAQDNVLACSKVINCGSAASKTTPHGLSERTKYLAKAKEIWPTTACDVVKKDPLVLELGDYSEHVRTLQIKLKALGYQLGAIDGRFGGATERALVAFQHEHELKADGICGPKTWDELEQGKEITHPERQNKTVADLIDMGSRQATNAQRTKQTGGVITVAGAIGSAVAPRLQDSVPVIDPVATAVPTTTISENIVPNITNVFTGTPSEISSKLDELIAQGEQTKGLVGRASELVASLPFSGTFLCVCMAGLGLWWFGRRVGLHRLEEYVSGANLGR